ncbi:MAG: hypothetical protein RL380_587 [Verrucomicrobiota bacterium]
MPLIRSALVVTTFWLASQLRAATFEVGPDQKLTALAQVPWEKLAPGDTVLIHARTEPYREKFVLCRAGRADAPITVRGLPDRDGQLPVIDGNGATTPPKLDYWGDGRGVIKIGGARKPADIMPAWLVLENLDVRGARASATFTAADGKKSVYLRNAAAIYVEKVEHLVLRGCRLRGCGNGLFVSSNDERASRDVTVEHCEFLDNGNAGSGREHHVYTAAIGISFLENHFGLLTSGSVGNSLKDRSAGLLVRGNFFEGGNKTLDLVDAQDSRLIHEDARWHEAVVTGNVILKLATDRHNFVVHYGGDGDQPAAFRSGPLVFTHNTVVSYRAGETALFSLTSPAQSVQCVSNLFVTLNPKGRLAVLETSGHVELGANWFSQPWRKSRLPALTNAVMETVAQTFGKNPGFVDAAKKDYRLRPDAPALGFGAVLKPASER